HFCPQCSSWYPRGRGWRPPAIRNSLATSYRRSSTTRRMKEESSKAADWQIWMQTFRTEIREINLNLQVTVVACSLANVPLALTALPYLRSDKEFFHAASATI
ncbi:hypothetical protein PMAYCL1PPCAC_17206, partial [Pristionchus mayeri]